MARKKKSTKLQTEVMESVHKIWLAGLGAMSTAEEEGGKVFNRLVEKGEAFEAASKEGFSKFKETVSSSAEKAKETADQTKGRLESTLDKQIASTLGRLGVPTRDEISKLTQRVEELTKAVDGLRAPVAPKRTTTRTATSRAAAKKAPARKTTTRKPAAKKPSAQ